MTKTNSQTSRKVVRKNFFRGSLFFSGLFTDLIIGGVGFFWFIQEVVFGLIFQGIPFFDWQIYFLLGVQNVPIILIAIYVFFLFLGVAGYGLYWRHLLSRLDREKSIRLGSVTVILASTAIVFSLVPGGILQLYRIWLTSITGTPSKILAIFVAIPATALSFGALAGRTGVIFRWSEKKRLIVQATYKKYGIGASIQLLAIPK